ncbi:MAG TPA: TetR family transcriptional regulator [Ornithinicoccus sp.]|nr:TetR family transcriptional regulator [Ornithinicoccus sp.]
MPRIDAATVAEHHAQQRRALLDAARALLAQTGEAPSMGAVGQRVGLARSSVYQYFDSAEELLTAVVTEVFPSWAEHILTKVAAAPTAGSRVWAYVEANIDLFASSEQAVARALTRVVNPQVLHGPMQDFHAQLQVPLREALRDLGEPDPDAMAEHVNSLIMQASRDLEAAERSARATLRTQTLGRLHRLLRGYLSLSDHLPVESPD